VAIELKKVKTMAVFGTRPEAIKMAPLVRLLKDTVETECFVCVTAQHRQMLDQVLSLFDIEPDFDMNIMRPRQTLSDITSRVLTGLDPLIEKVKPDILLVHGDTTTTLSAALAAFYRQIKVGHVEAGLRTHNKYFPYPEEINRRLTGGLADLHFAPTTTSRDNLLSEGINPEGIFITGNTVIDALKTTVKKDYRFEEHALNKIDYRAEKVLLLTAHRRENWGKPIADVCNAVKRIALEEPKVRIIYPVHYNPAVRDVVYPILGNVPNVMLLDPLDTADMHNLMSRCWMVLTDSGGLQEEAPSLGKPVLVLRDVTERPEAVEAGTVRVIGTDEEIVYAEALRLIKDNNAYMKMAEAVNPYGDGQASRRIVSAILYYLGLTDTRPDEFTPYNAVERARTCER
jgi:UDP-N-acetylglucosamine 2-epimerase (non-hydrolysing)